MGVHEDPYETLQVHHRACPEVITAAYRALARRFHPDVTKDPSDAGRMARLNAAWEILRDPHRRAAHDRQWAGASLAAARPSDADVAAVEDPPPPRAGRYEPGGEPGRRAADPHWFGAAGPPRGRGSGSVLDFGLYKGWSLGQIARADAGYLVWLAERREGHRHHAEIDRLLEEIGVRQPSGGPQRQGRLNFRRA